MFITYYRQQTLSQNSLMNILGFETTEESHDQLSSGLTTIFVPDSIGSLTQNQKQEYIKEIKRVSKLANNLRILLEIENKTIKDLYYTFFIDKKSGGKRRIDAPTMELKQLQKQIVKLLSEKLKILPSQYAYAYKKNTSAIDSLRRHQKENNKWFVKFDFQDFFGHITMDKIMTNLFKIYPLNTLMRTSGVYEDIKNILQFAFLNGSLPQGSPASPLLSNIAMIPSDYFIAKKLAKHGITYTRYADDILLSSKIKINIIETQKVIRETLRTNHCSQCINRQKTRCGSKSGKNWNLGLMLNKDNEITVGHVNKDKFRATLHNIILDYVNGGVRPENGANIGGIISYYKFIEPDYFNKTIKRYEQKYSVKLRNIL